MLLQDVSEYVFFVPVQVQLRNITQVSLCHAGRITGLCKRRKDDIPRIVYCTHHTALAIAFIAMPIKLIELN